MQALQKLIYVSALVFGERKAAFLLPWRRIAEVNDATIARAITDNGKLRMVAELGQRTSEMQVRVWLSPAATWLQGLDLCQRAAASPIMAIEGVAVRLEEHASHCFLAMTSSSSSSWQAFCRQDPIGLYLPLCSMQVLTQLWGQADSAFLEAARSLQTTLLVNDEGLAEVINEKGREDVEAALQRAFKVMEARTEKRDISLAIQVQLPHVHAEWGR